MGFRKELSFCEAFMRPVTVSVSSATTSSPVVISPYNQFQVGFGVALSAGANLTFKVQHTFDVLGDGTNGTTLPANATWFDHPTVTAKTTNSDGNYAYPIYALRLNVTAYTTGTATMTVISASY